MNREDVVQATREGIDASEKLAAHLERLRARLAASLPLDAGTLADAGDERRESLHAFLRMFEQLHDLVARRLFRGALALSGEDVAGLSARNLVRRLEAIGAVEDADAWLDLSTTRNLLVHDYPVNAAQQADRVNLAWRELPALLAATARVIGFILEEGLLP